MKQTRDVRSFFQYVRSVRFREYGNCKNNACLFGFRTLCRNSPHHDREFESMKLFL